MLPSDVQLRSLWGQICVPCPTGGAAWRQDTIPGNRGGRSSRRLPIFGRNLNKTLSHCAVEAIYVFSFTLNQPGFHTRFGVCQGDADPESRARLLHPEEGRDV